MSIRFRIPKQNFFPPINDHVTERNGLLSRNWKWYIREVYRRVKSLGHEKNFQLKNKMYWFTFTDSNVDTANDTISYSGRNLETGMGVYFLEGASGSLPSPLISGQLYFLIDDSASSKIKVADTYGDALDGTAINLTSSGTASVTNTAYPIHLIEKIDSTKVSNFVVDYYVQLISDTNESIESGQFSGIFKPTSGKWVGSSVWHKVSGSTTYFFMYLNNDGRLYYNVLGLPGTTDKVFRLTYRIRYLEAKEKTYSTFGGGS